MNTLPSEKMREQISRYIDTELSIKKISKTKFAEMIGVHPAQISHMLNPNSHEKAGIPFWNYLQGIYEAKAFDMIMIGEYIPYSKTRIPAKAKEKVPIEKSESDISNIKISEPGNKKEWIKPSLHTLKKSEISVGEAIDTLIKSGVKISMTLEINH